jgi:protein-tyrosine phosphatase
MHCHILPGVDDGARDIEESQRMLDAAKRVGITSIICTPHCRDPWFDFAAMWKAYDKLLALDAGIPITMGFEVNYVKLKELGWNWIDALAFRDTGEFLLELLTRCTAADFEDYYRAIYQIQGRGYTVIIAHPERYKAIQEDLSIAQRLVDMGCKLQASTDFIAGGRFGREKKPARALMKAGLYTYFASDAHRPEHYDYFAQVYKKFGDMLREE